MTRVWPTSMCCVQQMQERAGQSQLLGSREEGWVVKRVRPSLSQIPFFKDGGMFEGRASSWGSCHEGQGRLEEA